MRKVILDPATCAQLSGGSSPVAACDEQGKTVAVMMPVDIFNEMLDVWVKEVFAEDLAVAREEYRKQGAYTTDEVLARIDNLVRQHQRKE